MNRYGPFIRAGALALVYAVWIQAFRLITLSFITYFLVAASKRVRFEDISDTYAANELVAMGLAAFSFTAILKFLRPTPTVSRNVRVARFRNRFVPGVLHGTVFATGLTVAFVASGFYKYLGFYIQFAEAPATLFSIVLRVLAIGVFAYAETTLFQDRIATHLTEGLRSIRSFRPTGTFANLLDSALVPVATALLFVAIKLIQFDIGLMHAWTLFLVSLGLSFRTSADGDFRRAAGFWMGILLLVHPLFSLPVFGNDFSGLVLFKYQPDPEDLAAQSTTIRLLTGGPGGPLAGMVLQALLLMDIARNLLRQKKTLLNPAPTS